MKIEGLNYLVSSVRKCENFTCCSGAHEDFLSHIWTQELQNPPTRL